MSDTNVRVVFNGNAAGAVRASDQTADGVKKVGDAAQKSTLKLVYMGNAASDSLGKIDRSAREAARGLDQVKDKAEAGTRAINEERRAIEGLKVASLLGGAATAGRW